MGQNEAADVLDDQQVEVGHLPAVEVGGNHASDSRWTHAVGDDLPDLRTGPGQPLRIVVGGAVPTRPLHRAPRSIAVASRTSSRAVLPLPGLDTQLLTWTIVDGRPIRANHRRADRSGRDPSRSCSMLSELGRTSSATSSSFAPWRCSAGFAALRGVKSPDTRQHGGRRSGG